MDKYSQEYFDKIIAKDLQEMSESDKAFIRARASYLDRHNARRLQSVLDSKNTDAKPPVEENPVNTSIHPADRQDVEDTVSAEGTVSNEEETSTDKSIDEIVV